MTPFTHECVAVIFISQLRDDDDLRRQYSIFAKKISELAAKQPDYIHEDSSRSPDGFGVSVSYWKDQNDAIEWKRNKTHEAAQKAGKDKFDAWYHVRIANVVREYAGANYSTPSK